MGSGEAGGGRRVAGFGQDGREGLAGCALRLDGVEEQTVDEHFGPDAEELVGSEGKKVAFIDRVLPRR